MAEICILPKSLYSKTCHSLVEQVAIRVIWATESECAWRQELFNGDGHFVKEPYKNLLLNAAATPKHVSWLKDVASGVRQNYWLRLKMTLTVLTQR